MSEELWSAHYELRQSSIAHIRVLEQTVALHSQELAINHECFFALVELVDRQQERIERLESIIVAMANHGTVSTYPDDGPVHTHVVYLNGARELVSELEAKVENDPVAVLQAELDDPHH